MRVGVLLRAPERTFAGPLSAIGVVATAGIRAQLLASGGLTSLGIARAAPVAGSALSTIPRPEAPRE